MRTLESLVAEMPIFADMPGEDKALIAGCASNVRFEPGELLGREGAPANSFFFLRRGRVALELFVPHRGGVTIETIEAGDVVGWSWLVPPFRWHFDVRAIEPVLATAFDGGCLRAKCERDPRFGYELMLRFSQIPSQRLRAARLHFADVCGRSPSPSMVA
jgi:CRP/FNR family cyclic AMP-dependent transcriptional regulator